MRGGMSDFPFRIVGFDLDGTLVDTLGDLAAAVNHALALIDRPSLTEAAVRPMIGMRNTTRSPGSSPRSKRISRPSALMLTQVHISCRPSGMTKGRRQ